MPDDDEKDREIARLNNDVAELRKKLRQETSARAQLEAAAGGHETELAAARAEGAKEAKAEMTKVHAQELAGAEVRMLAAAVLHDPEDALRYLDMTKMVTAEGKVDREAVTAGLATLKTERPYVFKDGAAPPPGGPPAPPAPSNGKTAPPAPGKGDQGPRPYGSADPDAPMNAAIRAAANRH